jgi:polyhydroxyalkanoate synthesis repressor PhaR
MSETAEAKTAPITIKKYANRRLYNTATSSYVTLDHLASMVKEGVEFVVFDAKTGEEITRAVLTQIIVEEENKGGQNLLPIGFLRQLIAFYGDNMQSLVPKYLEHSMQAFASNQERMREYFTQSIGTIGGIPPIFPFPAAVPAALEEMAKQNMAIFERAMSMFSPYGSADSVRDAPRPAGAASSEKETLSALQARLDELQSQLAKMSPKGD